MRNRSRLWPWFSIVFVCTALWAAGAAIHLASAPERYARPWTDTTMMVAAIVGLIALLVGGIQWIRRAQGARAGRVVGVVLGVLLVSATFALGSFAAVDRGGCCARVDGASGPVPVYACSRGLIALSKDVGVAGDWLFVTPQPDVRLECVQAKVSSASDGTVQVDNQACPSMGSIFVVH